MQAFNTALSMVFTWQVMITILLSSIFGCWSARSRTDGDDGDRAARALRLHARPGLGDRRDRRGDGDGDLRGDIPGCLLRLPGTPASAAYTEEAYAMTRSGQAGYVLGTNLLFSALAGCSARSSW